MLALVSVTFDPGSILVWALIGLIAGFLASKVMTGHGKGIVADVVIGIIGAFAIALTARTQSRASVRSVAVLVTALMLIAPLAIAFSHMTAAS